jgi:anti-anti-sigma factor
MVATIADGQMVPSGELLIVAGAQGTTWTIALEGAWELASQETTRRAVRRALERRPECVVLDLGGLTFIDSSGVRVVFELARGCAAQSIRLVIVPGARAVQRVFENAGLTESLPFLTPIRV